MLTGFKQGGQCIKQSGGDSPKLKKVSPKEKSLLNVPHRWQVENVSGGLTDGLCLQEKQKV